MYLVIRKIKMFKAAIFDMDGLMIDSERLTLDVYKIYMATLGLSITKEFYVTMNMDKILIQIYASKKFIQCVQIKSKKKELP